MLVDTDILIDLIRGYPPALAWLAVQAEPPLVSGFAALELAYGSNNASELANVRTFLSQFSVLWPGRDDASHAMLYAHLKLSHGIGVLDALTAALASQHGLAVGSFNVKHFSVVPGLSVVQPYVR